MASQPPGPWAGAWAPSPVSQTSGICTRPLGGAASSSPGSGARGRRQWPTRASRWPGSSSPHPGSGRAGTPGPRPIERRRRHSWWWTAWATETRQPEPRALPSTLSATTRGWRRQTSFGPSTRRCSTREGGGRRRPPRRPGGDARLRRHRQRGRLGGRWSRTHHTVSSHGIVGHQVHRVREFAYPFGPGRLLALHTDGVTDRFDLGAYPGLARSHPLLMAATLVRDFRRPADDACVVVARHLQGGRKR